MERGTHYLWCFTLRFIMSAYAFLKAQALVDRTRTLDTSFTEPRRLQELCRVYKHSHGFGQRSERRLPCKSPPVTLHFNSGHLILCGLGELPTIPENYTSGLVVSCLSGFQERENKMSQDFAMQRGMRWTQITISSAHQREKKLRGLLAQMCRRLGLHECVVIHCFKGIHRAAFLTLLFLMVSLGVDEERATTLLDLLRPENGLQEFLQCEAECETPEKTDARRECVRVWASYAVSACNCMRLCVPETAALPDGVANKELAVLQNTLRHAKANDAFKALCEKAHRTARTVALNGCFLAALVDMCGLSWSEIKEKARCADTLGLSTSMRHMCLCCLWHSAKGHVPSELLGQVYDALPTLIGDFAFTSECRQVKAAVFDYTLALARNSNATERLVALTNAQFRDIVRSYVDTWLQILEILTLHWSIDFEGAMRWRSGNWLTEVMSPTSLSPVP